MEDLAWVAPRALRHEEVILTVMEQGPVLPVRFGTVFSSLDSGGGTTEAAPGRLDEVFPGYNR